MLLAQHHHHRGDGDMATEICFVMEHPGVSREQRQKQRDSAKVPLLAQEAGAAVWASPKGSTMVALALHLGTRQVPLMIPTSL